MSLPAGTVLAERYRLVEPIGAGGMGEVYRAYDHLLERDVAVKILAEEAREASRRFLAEAQAMARLNHRNIVAVYDVGVDGATSYIIMEHVRGKTIREIDRPAHTIRQAIELVLQVLDALRFAHEHDVVHRDIKPGNVIVGDDGMVKVTDFGLARRMSDVGNLAQSSEIVGTIAFLPPERFMGKSGDRTGDLYAVGVLLYDLLTGVLPFAPGSDDLVATMIAHVNEVPAPPRLYNPRVPTALERIVTRLLESDPARRFQDAGAVIAALEDVRGSDARSLESPLPPGSHARAPARGTRAAAVALVERGIEMGRAGDAAGAETKYRAAIEMVRSLA